jgi:tRNA (guanine37-N1)-methyltransferase
MDQWNASEFRWPSSVATMNIDVITLFPSMVDGFCSEALLGKARERELVTLRCLDPREFATDTHRTVDDSPFGGGAGMVMKAQPLAECIEHHQVARPLFALTAGGTRFDQSMARQLAAADGFSLLCGRYEGIDQRLIDTCCDGELSVGDVVLGGGEVAACLVIEAVTRLVPGVMGNDISGITESFSEGLLEEPQYTRPAEWRGVVVPDVLRSGDHAKVHRWRRATSLRRTLDRRPDLFDESMLSPSDRKILGEFGL